MGEEALRIGIIGTGGIAQAHLERLQGAPGTVIAALCDIDEKRAKATQAKFGGTIYGNFREMLAREKPDLAFLCTPQMVREEPIAACAKAGVPVFCEKPAARDVETGKRITRTVKEAGILVSVGFLFRYYRIVEKAKELLGKRPILAMNLYYQCGMMYPERRGRDFFYKKELSGGLIVDQAIHLLDLTRHMLGEEIEEAHAYGSNLYQPKTADITTEEAVVMGLRSKRGVPVSYMHTWLHQSWQARMEIWAEKVYLAADMFKNVLTGVLDGMEISYAPGDDGMKTEDLVFLDAARKKDGRGIRSSYEDAVKSLALALAVSESVDRGTPVKVA
ncbi:MAG: Gfo/Idh/MocA family oxidoreductase [Planctomycetota bacterium]